jgi:16S rRNA (cytidine1402-2'-O)-methyltransferase
MATFYVVATPIGNLEDMTLRALRILREASLVVCEDTRVTKKLLQKYDISTPTLSYPADAAKPGQPSFENKVEKIFSLLEEGKDVALVTDAGTPALSDPGFILVAKIRERFPVITIPGPSALAAALSVAGLPSSDFLFLGFLPHKKGRETLFKEIAASKRTVVFYESPHRILKSLESLNTFLPAERKVSICRELTKIYEETVSGTPAEVLAYFISQPEKVRGEFVVIVGA